MDVSGQQWPDVISSFVRSYRYFEESKKKSTALPIPSCSLSQHDRVIGRESRDMILFWIVLLLLILSIPKLLCIDLQKSENCNAALWAKV